MGVAHVIAECVRDLVAQPVGGAVREQDVAICGNARPLLLQRVLGQHERPVEEGRRPGRAVDRQPLDLDRLVAQVVPGQAVQHVGVAQAEEVVVSGDPDLVPSRRGVQPRSEDPLQVASLRGGVLRVQVHGLDVSGMQQQVAGRDGRQRRDAVGVGDADDPHAATVRRRAPSGRVGDRICRPWRSDDPLA